MRDETIRLRDGRRLGFAEFGPSDGRPVLFFHGIPGSRLFFQLAELDASRLGVRLIAPERPGYGTSDFLPQRRLVQWADDVRQLADRLRLETFSVAGVSGGAPYSLVCARFLPERIVRAGLVSAMGPVDHPLVVAHMTSRHRFRLAVFRLAPISVHAVCTLAGWCARNLPARLLAGILPMFPPASRHLLEAEGRREVIVRSIREAFRQGGRGVARDLLLMSLPWGFQLEEVAVPVALWHGADDINLPVVLSQAISASLPNCNARIIPGADHAWILDHFGEVLAGV